MLTSNRHSARTIGLWLAATTLVATSLSAAACGSDEDATKDGSDASVGSDSPSGDGGTDPDGAVDGATEPEAREHSLAAGAFHTCALLSGGQVKCWGGGALGLGDTRQRGDDPGEMGSTLPFVDLGPGRTARALSAGLYHTCALLDDAKVKCWGVGEFGALGLADLANHGDEPGEMGAALPALDLGSGTIASLASGGQHNCVIFSDGSVKCWGINQVGQLGLGDAEEHHLATATLPNVDLGPGRTARMIAAAGNHTCAVLDDGSVKCWGGNHLGQLGLGDTAQRGDGPGEMGAALPTVDLGPGRTALGIVVGIWHTCARLDDGSVKCWGSNASGQLGLGDKTNRGAAPGQMGASLPTVDLGPGRKVLALSAGYETTCARLDDGSVKCWGRNEKGQLGVGDSAFRGDAPQQMGAALPVVDLGPGRRAHGIAGTYQHTCARLDDGTVRCWGWNLQGQLGVGDTESRGDGPGEMGLALPALPLE